MAEINFVVPPLHRKKFSGGIWCVLQYADGLAKRGHKVNVVPMLPSPEPEWFRGDYKIISWGGTGEVFQKLYRLLTSGVLYLLKRKSRLQFKKSLDTFVYSLSFSKPKVLPYELARAAQIRFVREVMPQADITIATSFDTALPVHLYGAGKKFYFMQHFEPYFMEEFPEPILAEKEALLSYRLDLSMIANSTWLKTKLEESVVGAMVSLCPNAINHEVFFGLPKVCRLSNAVRVISYGGRNAVWKGFEQMAYAVKLARESMPNVEIKWLVYGDALLPPNNHIAEYQSLGFLEPKELANAYRGADILLSASWYESFPLFPIEAMACGLPVITTALGTEDYAKHADTAEIVEPKNVEEIAKSLVRLISDDAYRNKLAKNGNMKSKEFTWGNSVERMENIIVGAV